ncbi:MAG: DinB family protein [Anaerolineales bacterium]
MDILSYLREEIQWAHQVLEMTMADVTPEQAHWLPPGEAHPVGASYVHVVCSEDGVVSAFLKGGAPMFTSTWAGKTGASVAQWENSLEWARRVQVDLPTFRTYAQAVYAATNDYLNSVTEADLDRQIDLSSVGMGQRSVGWILGALLMGRLHNLSGEISAVRGAQELKGYPF